MFVSLKALNNSFKLIIDSEEDLAKINKHNEVIIISDEETEKKSSLPEEHVLNRLSPRTLSHKELIEEIQHEEALNDASIIEEHETHQQIKNDPEIIQPEHPEQIQPVQVHPEQTHPEQTQSEQTQSEQTQSEQILSDAKLERQKKLKEEESQLLKKIQELRDKKKQKTRS